MVGPTAGTLVGSGRATTYAGAGGGGVTINVNGALDPEAVARQIERILSGAQRRRGGVTIRQRAAGPSAVGAR
jgi:hypothetical protein